MGYGETGLCGHPVRLAVEGAHRRGTGHAREFYMVGWPARATLMRSKSATHTTAQVRLTFNWKLPLLYVYLLTVIK